ncbi:alpha-1,2-fucosyltransferase [Marinoscillum sp. 108]|uniref:alpha-1,2-fucosyltransferase n=1 Tax=Marinoscillum sp. 108 TaxID=2653151 RepID=UPI0012F0C432|nr:putative Alpha-1,2-fucosyltransferase [Marinoscillum sp. 108]
MIIINSRGQLGNQLFQYAFGLATSRHLKTPFLITKIDLKDDLQYFVGPSRNLGYLLKRILHPRLYNFMLRCMWGGVLKKEVNVSNWDHPDSAKPLLERGAFFIGYFQSSLFFESHRNLIVNSFRVRPKYVMAFDKLYANKLRRRKLLVIHVRRGDYQHSGNEKLGYDLSLPVQYYEMARSYIDGIDQYYKVVVTNDVAYCEKNLTGWGAHEIVQNEAIIDFQLIQFADVAIISNSTFAWWAAYLNKKEDRQVIVPKYWLGFKVKREYPVAVIPEGWHQIEIDG